MLMAALMLFGFISFKNMGIGQMPDVDFPVLNVQITWEGAAPEVIERDVVDFVEDALMSVEGLKEISSSSRQGEANVSLEFDLGRNIDIALQEAQSKLSEVQRRLPSDIDPPIIRKSNPEDRPVMWIGVSGNRSLQELMQYVDLYIRDRFKNIEGVGEITLSGFTDRNLRIWIDMDKLRVYELTVQDVIRAIQAEHIEIPAGRIESELTETTVRAMGEARSVEEFQKITISERGGQPIYKPIPLREVAEIEDGLADVRRISRTGGETTVGIGIRKQSGSNTVEIGRAARKRIDEIAQFIPSDLKIGVNYDTTHFIEEAVDELVFTLLLSAALTSIVCWLFFGSFQTTLNILLAIPTSLLGTFIVIQFLGFTLNTFTLLGLTLAIGIVVDDAIMVLENIVRHREEGKGQREAALTGATQITFAALAASLAIIAIFIPVVYMKGIIGHYFYQFGVTMSIAVMISLLEALTLTPMRCAEYLSLKERSSRFGKWFEGGIHWTAQKYGKILGVVLRHRMWVLIFAAVSFVISLQIVPLLKREMVPPQDQGSFMARIKTNVGSSIQFTNEKFIEIEKILMENPNVKRYMSAVGGFGGGEANSGNIFITLKELSHRPIDSTTGKKLDQAEVMDQLRSQIKKIPDIQVSMQDNSMRGFSSRRGYPIEMSIRGLDWDKLVEYSHIIQERMENNSFFADVDSDYVEGMPEIRVIPNRDKAFEYGVSISTIAQTINTLIGGERISKYESGGRRYDVRVQLKREQRMSPDVIKSLRVWNNRGEIVELASVVDIQAHSSLLSITRKNRERAIGVFANVASGQSQAQAIEAARAIAEEVLPEGYRAIFGGASQTFKESFDSLMVAFWLGIIVAYMILASQSNRWLQPFVVLLALPFSVSGALIALWLGGHSLNIFSMIGLLLLMGIVKKNSILLVEFTDQIREEGLSAHEALLKACPLRFRPILMTSVATIAAAIPPVMSIGPGSETSVPMAAAIIGGVFVSTLLTFFVIPCAYLALSRWEKR